MSGAGWLKHCWLAGARRSVLSLYIVYLCVCVFIFVYFLRLLVSEWGGLAKALAWVRRSILFWYTVYFMLPPLVFHIVF